MQITNNRNITRYTTLHPTEMKGGTKKYYQHLHMREFHNQRISANSLKNKNNANSSKWEIDNLYENY